MGKDDFFRRLLPLSEVAERTILDQLDVIRLLHGIQSSFYSSALVSDSDETEEAMQVIGVLKIADYIICNSHPNVLAQKFAELLRFSINDFDYMDLFEKLIAHKLINSLAKVTETLIHLPAFRSQLPVLFNKGLYRERFASCSYLLQFLNPQETNNIKSHANYTKFVEYNKSQISSKTKAENPDTDSKKDKLFEQACTERDSREMGSYEYAEVFAYKLGIPKDEICGSEIIETRVLQNILSKCKTIPSDINVNGHATWVAEKDSATFSYPTLIINYPTLSLEQRKEMVAAYNNQYGPIAELGEDFMGGFFKQGQAHDGIIFNKALFCKKVLPDLKSQPENTVDEPMPQRPANMQGILHPEEKVTLSKVETPSSLPPKKSQKNIISSSPSALFSLVKITCDTESQDNDAKKHKTRSRG